MKAIHTALWALALGTMAVGQEPVQEPAAEEFGYARVLAEVQPRCFASNRSPVYEDKLQPGQIVRVGKQVGGFRAITLPLGVTGYVHKKFSGEPVDGMVTATATNVSFRYRPRSSEVPALLMPQGTQLHFLEETDDWWTVRNPAAPAYLAAEELDVIAEPTAEIAQGWADLDAARHAEWQEKVEARAASIEAAAALEQKRGELDLLVETFRLEAQKPVEEQSFAELTREVDGLLSTLPEESGERLRAQTLRREIERQELVARAVRVVNADAPVKNVAEEVLPQPNVDDGLARFDAVGWLHRETPFGGAQRFTLQKGGRLLYVVTCNTGRYDLGLLDGVEVGIVGSKQRPSPDSVRELDALKIEILKLAR